MSDVAGVKFEGIEKKLVMAARDYVVVARQERGSMEDTSHQSDLDMDFHITSSPSREREGGQAQGQQNEAVGSRAEANIEGNGWKPCVVVAAEDSSPSSG